MGLPTRFRQAEQSPCRSRPIRGIGCRLRARLLQGAAQKRSQQSACRMRGRNLVCALQEWCREQGLPASCGCETHDPCRMSDNAVGKADSYEGKRHDNRRIARRVRAPADAALAAAVAGFDVIQAEKFSPAEIAALVRRMASMAYTRARPIIAAAGGVNAANAAAYAEAGADVLVTSSPYLAKPRDVQVQIAAAEADRPRARLDSRKDSIAPASA